jgi:hypothetical protein
VKEVFYQFGADTKYLSYAGPVSLRNFKDGQYTFTFYSIDNAGNEESKKSLKFNIDNAPPIPDVALEGDLFGFKNGQIVISSRTLMKASAIDSQSNVGKIEYSVNNSAYALYSAPVPVSSLPGRHIVNIRATDNVGNTSNPVAVTVTIDVQPPKSKHLFIGPIYQNNGMTCISPETKIELKAQDDLAGVANIKYSSDGENSTEYLAPISITKEGSSILKYRGTDKVNNQEETQVIALFLDKTPPTIVESFGSKKLNDGEIAHYPKGTTLFLQATDNSSGLKGIWYSINGGNESKYDNALKITRKGEHKIIVRAQDNVGMTTVKTISFVIEDTKK